MLYPTFIGIDIGKNEFVTALHGEKLAKVYSNTPAGNSDFFDGYSDILKDSLVVLESTGGYENDVLSFLLKNSIKVHRADTRKVKSFIRSYGQKGKTDKIDALALALYGHERQSTLALFKPNDLNQTRLKSFEERRLDLKQMLVQEKNREKSPLSLHALKSIKSVIVCLEEQIIIVNKEIKDIIEIDEDLSRKKETLKNIPGIGEITANTLLALVPELGHLNRKQIASLCGLAPYPKQSGTKTWYSHTMGGRRNLRPILFMAAMGARRTKTSLAEFYETLVKNGKKKMVALVALMRKIIVIANAKIRDLMRVTNQ
jgi:transposase